MSEIPVIRVAMAPTVNEDSWLHEPRFKNTLSAYYYATTQTNAISGLSKISPEEAAHVFWAMHRAFVREGGVLDIND